MDLTLLRTFARCTGLPAGFRADRRGPRKSAVDRPLLVRGLRRQAHGLRYLCADALAVGEVMILLDPAVPPLRTNFLAVRTGTPGLPHIARAQEGLLRTAVDR